MRLLIVGPPGAGKGTQAVTLARSVRGAHISTGEIFRAHVHQGTALGTTARRYIDAGAYVPDEVTNAMVRERLAQDDAHHAFVLDGCPRTVDQVQNPRQDSRRAECHTRRRHRAGRRPRRTHQPPAQAGRDDRSQRRHRRRHPPPPGPVHVRDGSAPADLPRPRPAAPNRRPRQGRRGRVAHSRRSCRGAAGTLNRDADAARVMRVGSCARDRQLQPDCLAAAVGRGVPRSGQCLHQEEAAAVFGL